MEKNLNVISNSADLLSFEAQSTNKPRNHSIEHLKCFLPSLVSGTFEQITSKLPSRLPPRFVTWVSSFLANRSIFFVVDGKSSDLHCCNVGCAQASVLDQLYFYCMTTTFYPAR